jgi:hypothetical protein
MTSMASNLMNKAGIEKYENGNGESHELVNLKEVEFDVSFEVLVDVRLACEPGGKYTSVGMRTSE